MCAVYTAAILGSCLTSYLVYHHDDTKVELYYPALDHGARIPGTNYSVDGKDTLEIVKSVNYNYRILNQAERKQAREYIKSLRK